MDPTAKRTTAGADAGAAASATFLRDCTGDDAGFWSEDKVVRAKMLRASSDRIASLSLDFRRLHALASSPSAPPRYPTMSRATTVCPSGLTDREKMHFMDSYLPNSSAHYGGSLPTSPFLQSQCVMVRSHHVWRNQKYALPAHLTAFRQFEAAAARKEKEGQGVGAADEAMAEAEHAAAWTQQTKSKGCIQSDTERL